MDYSNKLYQLCNNFIFGYGSTINDESRKKTVQYISSSIPVRILKSFGCRRCWNFQSNSAKLTALGIEFTKKPSTINGIIFPVNKSELKLFDIREEGYKRIKIPIEHIESTSWYSLPKHECIIWIYGSGESI